MHMHVDPAHESGKGIPEHFSWDEQERIRRRAHQIYEERGRAEGQALNDWLQAKAEVISGARRIKLA